MTSQKQILANRNNAKLSTGPKTAEGMEHIKYNALKHGFRAATFVIMPNEKPEEHATLVDDLLTDLEPANAAEEILIRHVADLSWMIDRAKWQEGQLQYHQISDAMAQADRARVDHNRDALHKLLPTAEKATSSIYDHVGVNPLRTIVESTAEGCDHLLSAWQGLRATTLAQQPWNDLQECHAVHLLGFGDKTIYDPGVFDIVVANRFVRDPKINAYHWSNGSCGLYFGWDAMHEALDRKPADVAQAFALMLKTADQAIARLEGVLAERKRDGDLGKVEVINPVTPHVIIDPSVDIEKTRKYRASLSAELLRTFDALTKLRKEQARHRKEMGENVRQECRTQTGEPASVSAPNEAILVEASAMEGEPDPDFAPNEAILEPVPPVNRTIRNAPLPAVVPDEANMTRRQRRQKRKEEQELARQARRSQRGK